MPVSIMCIRQRIDCIAKCQAESYNGYMEQSGQLEFRSAEDLSALDMSSLTLNDLCELVINQEFPFDDLAEEIEDKAYLHTQEGDFDGVVVQLRILAEFFERMEQKSAENVRDLADIYLLIGEMYATHEDFEGSVTWFNRAIIVDDQYDVPYHSLANSFLRLGEVIKAVQCLEQELIISPGNYYTYLLVADLYEKTGREQDYVRVLEMLLERDPDNIRGLHTLICHYEKVSPEMDMTFFRKRLLTAHPNALKQELFIWTYHMSRDKRFQEALGQLKKHAGEYPGQIVPHLLLAHIYGELGQYSSKRRELAEFKRLAHGNDTIMQVKFDEFQSIFGSDAAQKISRRLAASHPTRR